MPRCFKIHGDDNVATLLDDAPAGPVELLGAGGGAELSALDAVPLGHKIALADIPAGGRREVRRGHRPGHRHNRPRPVGPPAQLRQHVRRAVRHARRPFRRHHRHAL